MKINLVVVGKEGVAVCEEINAEWQVVRRGLEGGYATCLVSLPDAVVVGTKQGIFRSQDAGRSWQPSDEGLTIPHVRWMTAHPDDRHLVLAGTEPAGIFVSQDGGQTWRACPEVSELRDRLGWSLPYSPEAGCVRGFAMNGDWAFAAVEDGGVLVSQDRGETWQLAGGSSGKADHDPEDGSVHSDVHSVVLPRAFPDQVYASTGGGFFVSKDGGHFWDAWYPKAYCRDAWVDPADPSRVLLGPADGVDSNGYIVVTYDAGRNWESAAEGLQVPMPNTMVERFVYFDDGLLVVLSNGELYSAHASGLFWRRLLPEINSVEMAAFYEER